MNKNISNRKMMPRFTLVGFLENTAVSSLCFFKRCDQREQQNTSLFLKKGEGKNLFPSETKFFPSHVKPFTLIELLVVIAMIAILAAILLPALQSARERGKMSGCISNLKNMSQALFRYADDFNENGPSDSGDQGYTPTVFSAPVVAGYLMQDKVRRPGHIYLHLLCPSAKYTETNTSYLAGAWSSGGNRLITSYANAFGYGKRDNGSTWFKWFYESGVSESIHDAGVQRQLPSLRMFNRKLTYETRAVYQTGSPAKHPMVGDADTNNDYPARMTVYGYSSGPRHHKTGNNNIFLDGHYEFSKYGTFNNIFCYNSSRGQLRWTSN